MQFKTINSFQFNVGAVILRGTLAGCEEMKISRLISLTCKGVVFGEKMPITFPIKE